MLRSDTKWICARLVRIGASLLVVTLLAAMAGACGSLQQAGVSSSSPSSSTQIAARASSARAIEVAAPYIAGVAGSQVVSRNVTSVEYVSAPVQSAIAFAHVAATGAIADSGVGWLFVATGEFEEESRFTPAPAQHTLLVLVRSDFKVAFRLTNDSIDLAQLGEPTTVIVGESSEIDAVRAPGGAGPLIVATPSVPTIEIGVPTLANGQVQIPVDTAGTGFAAYSGFTIHLTWSPVYFSFASANDADTVLPSPLCIGPKSDGGAGVIFACASQGGSTTATGLLATFVLTPASPPGCSRIHLFTLGGADDGDTSTGTFTVDASSNAPQTAATSDARIDGVAEPC